MAGSDQIGHSAGHRRSMSASFHRASIARSGSFGVVRGHSPTSLDQGSRIYALVGIALFYVAKVGVAGSNPVVRSKEIAAQSQHLSARSKSHQLVVSEIASDVVPTLESSNRVTSVQSPCWCLRLSLVMPT